MNAIQPIRPQHFVGCSSHLLAFVFTSNDTDIFNELSKSLIQSGDGPWSPMYPADIGGKGKKMVILPK